MKKLVIFLILAITVNNTLAQSISLKKGQSAPFDGVLTDHPTSQKIVQDLEEGDYHKKRAESLQKFLELQDLVLDKKDRQLQILIQQNDVLQNRVEKSESSSSYERLMWFGLGVLGTGLSVYGAQKLLR